MAKTGRRVRSYDSGLDKDCRGRGEKKWSDSYYILTVEPIGLVNGLDMKYEEIKVKDDIRLLCDLLAEWQWERNDNRKSRSGAWMESGV